MLVANDFKCSQLYFTSFWKVKCVLSQSLYHFHLFFSDKSYPLYTYGMTMFHNISLTIWVEESSSPLHDTLVAANCIDVIVAAAIKKSA